MKQIFHITAIVSLVLVSLANQCSAAERAAPGSFLTYRAVTVGELVNQVENNATVNKRYARHFNVSPEQVTEYFKEELKLITLQSPQRVKTWYVAKDGRIHSKNKLLPKGSQVFANKEGKMVLIWACGNPLRTNLPQPAVAKKPKKVAPTTAAAGMSEVAAAAPAESTVLTATPEPETMVLANPAETIAAAAATVAPGFVAETAPVLAAMETVAAAPALVPVSAAPVAVAPAIVGSSGGGIGALGALAGLGGLAAALGGGGGDDPTLAPVPEPTTIAAMATGLASFAGFGVFRRRRK